MAWFKKRKPEADAPRSATPTQQIEDDGQTPVDMLAPPEDASAYPRQAQSASFQEDGDSFEEEDIEGDGALPSAGAAARQRLLWLLLVVGLIALLVAGWWTISRTERAFGGAGAVGEALLQSQRLSKSASQAIAGSPGAFSELVESSRALSGSLNRLRSNLGADYADELGKIAPLADRAGKNASVIIAQQQALINASAALRVIHSQSASLLDAANQISTLEVQRGSSPAEISAAGQLVMLTERIGKSTSEMLVPAGMSGQAAQGLDKDLVTLRGTAQNLLDGNSDLKLSATHDASTRGKITDLLATLDRIHTKAASLVTNPQGLSDAGAAQSSIDAD
ncbi:MAG: type IV pili methyl-accepting chemotaxis transducer N-terminal domain-containing protein, partial [Burkholderiaceae bacterium]|nr:type IV pili methyl-accepting chemotaxis transducer N-terminal domain-containing protein [Burkholderiaceae bacterium]